MSARLRASQRQTGTNAPGLRANRKLGTEVWKAARCPTTGDSSPCPECQVQTIPPDVTTAELGTAPAISLLGDSVCNSHSFKNRAPSGERMPNERCDQGRILEAFLACLIAVNAASAR